MALGRRKARNPLFRKRWFRDDTIIRAVRWYLRYKLSYRDLAAIFGGTRHLRCPLYHLALGGPLLTRLRPLLATIPKAGWTIVAIDETYIKVGGRWMFLYRAVDQHG